MRISACLIVKNSEKSLERALKSLRPHVDEIVVVDTGSSDGTLDIVKKYADKWETFLGPNQEWAGLPFILDFALARQRSFDLATGDWLLWLDSDDEFIGGEKLKGLTEAETDVYFMHYTYAHDGQGRTYCELYRERLMRRSSIDRWFGQVHEVCFIKPGARITRLTPDIVDVMHYPEHKNPTERNLTILTRMLEHDSGNPRTLYYLGRESKGSDPKKAEEYFERLLKIEWAAPEERYQAAHMLADMHRLYQHWFDADRLDGLAMSIIPEWGDAYFGLAETAFARAQWPRVIYWTELGLAKGVPQTSAILNPMDYVWAPHIPYNFALNSVGRVDDAIKSCETALAVQYHPTLQTNLGFLKRHQQAQAIARDTHAMIDHYRGADEWIKMDRFLQVVPHLVEADPQVEKARKVIEGRMALIKDPRAYRRVYGDDSEIFPWKERPYEDVPKVLARAAWVGQSLKEIGAKTVLDVGACDGFVAIWLAKQGYTVHAVEMNPKSVAYGKQACITEGVADKVIWHESAAEDFFFDGAVDAAYCFETLEHVVDPAIVLKNIDRHVKPGGKVHLCTPHGEWEPNPKSLEESVPGHLHAFTVKSMGTIIGTEERHQVWLDLNYSGNPQWPYQAHLWASYMVEPPVDIILPTVYDSAVKAFCQDKLGKAEFYGDGVGDLYLDDGSEMGPGTFPQRVNRNLKKTTAPYILILNDDVALTRETVQQMRAHFAKNPKLGILGMFSNCDYGWHHQEQPCGIGIGPTVPEVESKWADVVIEAAKRRTEFAGQSKEVPWLAFYCIMIKRELLETVGFLDERCLNYGDDADYSARAKRAGYEIRYALDGLVIHFGGVTLNKQPEHKKNKRQAKRWVAIKKNLPKVAIYAPLVWEPWSPRVLAQKGCGGSETAAIQMAKGLTEQGHVVDVFNENDGERFYAGVGYYDFRRVHPDGSYNVCVAWRAPEIGDFPLEWEQTYLWMHDWDVGDRLTEQRARKFDAILVLSEAHKAHMLERYPFLTPDSIWVTSNGVDLARFGMFDGTPISGLRQRKKVIYSSSPDRGLDVLLTFWPKVIAQVPDAELHVFYGWGGIDRAIAAGQPGLAEFKAGIEAQLAQQPSVKWRGSLSQHDLTMEFYESSLWLYPSYFTETSCITAMEAQLAGAIPVTRPLAALKETVLDGILIDGDVRDAAVQERYVAEVVRLLTDGVDASWRESIAKAARERFGWSRVAEQWHQWFTAREEA